MELKLDKEVTEDTEREVKSVGGGPGLVERLLGVEYWRELAGEGGGDQKVGC